MDELTLIATTLLEDKISMAVMSQFEGLSLAEKSALSLDSVDEDYVLDVAVQSGEGNYIAATSSNHTIRLFSSNNLASVGVITGHTDVISGITWGKSEPNLLYSSSKDKSVRCWDTRMKPTKEVQKLEGSAETENIFTCVDINTCDRVLCAGQEADDEENAFILFWDRRGSELLGVYSESHQDDITQVCFHPTNADSLITGSTDGLVCLFDISQTCEDDALSYTWNTCSTVAKIGWCGENWTNVYGITHIDTFHVWDSVEGDPVVEVTDLKDVLQGTNAVDYIVDCLACESSDLHLLAGRHNGDLKIIELSRKGIPKVMCSLSGGHAATVRCLHWNLKSNELITGAEDSLLCLWSTKQSNKETVIPPSKAKLKSKKPIGKRSNPY